MRAVARLAIFICASAFAAGLHFFWCDHQTRIAEVGDTGVWRTVSESLIDVYYGKPMYFLLMPFYNWEGIVVPKGSSATAIAVMGIALPVVLMALGAAVFPIPHRLHALRWSIRGTVGWGCVAVAMLIVLPHWPPTTVVVLLLVVVVFVQARRTMMLLGRPRPEPGDEAAQPSVGCDRPTC